ncbi:hypothetical protein PQ692_10935 [Thermoanaerobacterium thermosaccharolyticum]|uniref:hypothetical protein n=1 Tax=Thermoanaerobacterium thermosaccharolyticum TaxID=1517 RepID=UPI003DA911B5
MIWEVKNLLRKQKTTVCSMQSIQGGYSSSVVEPLKNLVNELELKKSSFEMNGHTAISKKILI